MTTAASKQERQERLASLIFQHGTIRVDALQAEMGVSAMTLYRDLADLQARHVITRSRGEVSAIGTTMSETSFAFRLSQEAEAKKSLGALAATLIGRGDAVFIDDSTTSHFVLREGHISGMGLTVVTNSIETANLVAPDDSIDLVTIGGRFERRLQSFYGSASLMALAQLRTAIAFLGAASIGDGVASHPFEEVAQFKRTLLTRSHTTVLLATASKFERTAMFEVAPLTAFDYIVTDASADDPQVLAAAEAGVTILRP